MLPKVIFCGQIYGKRCQNLRPNKCKCIMLRFFLSPYSYISLIWNRVDFEIAPWYVHCTYFLVNREGPRDHPFKTSAHFHDFWPLPPPLGVSYYCPLANLSNFWPPPSKKCRRLKCMVPYIFNSIFQGNLLRCIVKCSGTAWSVVKVRFFRRYYVAHQIPNFFKHFTVPMYWKNVRDSKIFTKIGDLRSNIIFSENNLTLLLTVLLSMHFNKLPCYFDVKVR